MKQSTLPKLSVLLVDDETGFRETMSKRLTKRGMEILQAEDGPECLALLEKQDADVVIMDVKMPGISGLDTLREIRRTNQDQQVILLTGNAAVADGVEGIKAGAFDYLTKPVEIDHLANKIRQAWEMSRLAQYQASLEEKMIATERLAALGTLSTGIAHEINNPLAIINEAAGFMKHTLSRKECSREELEQMMLKGIEKIEKSIQRARKITFQLLGHVRKQAGHMIRFDFPDLLKETLVLLEKELSDKQIRIVWEKDPGQLIINSDPYQIRQVLINLLSNAFQAVKQGGVITLDITRSNDRVCLTIKDNGVGIPKEHQTKIFDPFFTTKTPEQGTGLGLFLVHKILTRLCGSISIDSRIGKGTCCTVLLPEDTGTECLEL